MQFLHVLTPKTLLKNPMQFTGIKILAFEPGKGDRVLWVTRPNASQEDVHVEEVFHGNSSEASRIACSLTG